ncbi:peptidylprolyl isomerase [Paenibacillus sp. TAB 01]|uniref:peptidylprolyl isomerase n=1 Tax=Paenibacillus sp. TAB 01 TaxID=3368988 RepID=UPI00375159E1
MSSGILGLFLLLAASLHFISTSNDSSAALNDKRTEQRVEIDNSAVVKEEAGKKQYANPPEMTIDVNKSYQARFKTNKGDFTVELYAKAAPKTVNNFVFLAREGFYDDIVFHRIIKTFMVQTGDPTGTGTGGPGYQFEDELSSQYTYEPGIVAMANAGPDTNGSQFFICTGEDSKSLDQFPNYTIFGRVTDGMDTVLKIADTRVERSKITGEESQPAEKVIIESIIISES